MTVRLLLDEMYPPLLAAMLRDMGHDVAAVAASAELAGAADAAVLDAATTDDRCLLTENVRDFAVLARYTTHNMPGYFWQLEALHAPATESPHAAALTR